jgi:hypothetical protein
MSDQPATANQGPQVGFAADIRPLFRDTDRAAMRRAFDLWSHDDVLAHGQAIAGRLNLDLAGWSWMGWIFDL